MKLFKSQNTKLKSQTFPPFLKEYPNYLNIALGSCGEFHSCYTSCKQAEQITADDYQRLDQLHFKVENALLKPKLCVFDHYSMIPTFHHCRWAAQNQCR